MQHRSIVRFTALFLALALILPAVSSLALAKDSKGTVKSEIIIASTVWLAGKELKAGQYSVVVDGTKATVSREGKTIVEAPIQWQDGRAKSPSSAVVLEGNQVKEIRFSGQTRAAVVLGEMSQK